MPDDPEVVGLLALILLVPARRAARTTAGAQYRWPTRTAAAGIAS